MDQTQIVILIIAGIIGLTIQYLLVKAAVGAAIRENARVFRAPEDSADQ